MLGLCDSAFQPASETKNQYIGQLDSHLVSNFLIYFSLRNSVFRTARLILFTFHPIIGYFTCLPPRLSYVNTFATFFESTGYSP